MDTRSTSDVFSVSIYDYVTTGECTGFRWNLLNSTEDKLNDFLSPVFTRIMVLFLHPLCAVFGLLGNLSFMFIVWKVPYMRNSINIILLNLSVADFLFLLVGTGIKFVNLLNSPVFGDSFIVGHICHCLIIIPLLNVVSFASLLLVSLISVERYMAVCKPNQYLKMTCRRTLSCLSFVWVFSFALAAFLMPSTMDFVTVCVQWPNSQPYEKFPTKVGFCNAKSDFWYSVNEFLQIFPFFVALLLNVFCFARIFPRFYGRLTFKRPQEQAQQYDHITTTLTDSTNAATKMLLINGIAFFILATPFHVTSAIQFVESVSSNWWCGCREFKDISILLLYVNSAVNPFIYGMTNPNYRRAYYSVFCQNRYNVRRNRRTVTPSDNQSEKISTYV
ncbi:Neuromedin-U receptor 2 [Holothuria leucospilota]|uniref:Neuromedin-U receptor 2 n=1 Tax=Holothuria leucospilota TaxID=206669 RepID=A0A9Q1H926_HOLLE|nr:Neuromedin-U receptor 2 [Holothuria leucospilota]